VSQLSRLSFVWPCCFFWNRIRPSHSGAKSAQVVIFLHSGQLSPFQTLVFINVRLFFSCTRLQRSPVPLVFPVGRRARSFVSSARVLRRGICSPRFQALSVPPTLFDFCGQVRTCRCACVWASRMPSSPSFLSPPPLHNAFCFFFFPRVWPRPIGFVWHVPHLLTPLGPLVPIPPLGRAATSVCIPVALSKRAISPVFYGRVELF